MKEAAKSDDEEDRLNALYSYHILETPADSAFNELVELTAEICQVPIALISLVDESRQWFKAEVGLGVPETERSISLCAHAILQKDLFIVSDTLKDERFFDNPLVTSYPNIRFYAGAPLITEDGYGLGTLCVIDKKPRQLTSIQKKAICVLRRHVLTLLKLRQQNIELKALSEQLDAFNASAAHDLIAPSRRVAGFAQVLMEDYSEQLDGYAADLIARMKDSASDMKDLVNSLFDLSKISRSELKYERVCLSDIVINFLDELAESSDRQLVTDVSPDLIVPADLILMRIVLHNLLKNAWKYSANRDVARIRFFAEKKNGQRWFVVEDNGVGFDMSYAEKIFMPFQRLHPQEEYKGNGVGLATVQRIIQSHGGEVTITSKLNKGTKVSFTLDVQA